MAVAQLLLRPSLLLSIFLVLSPTTHSIIESEALLKLKKSFTKADALSSWVPGSSPCKEGAYWIGLICYNGIVAGLRLEGMNLSGKIDVEALLEMPALRSVSITNNAFSGPIPEFNRLGALKALFLSGNQFSGEIPSDYFAKMESLKKIYLSDNKLTGKIPSSLAQLSNLKELHLENNQFVGEIPSLDQPTLTSINVSNNRLEGEIPASSFSRFDASSFAGNAGLCGEKLGRECQKALDQPTTGNGDSSKKMIAAIMTSVVAFISIAAVLVVRFRRNREDFDAEDVEEEAVEVHVSQSGPNGKEEDSMREEGNNSSRKGSINGKGVGMGELVVVNDEKGVFGLSDLMKASAEVLENGALVSSYKAVMANGVAVVVKRMKEMNTLGRDVFDAEMRRLANQRHQNILAPLAYHYRKDEKLLVYEYIPGRSLLHLLHGDRGPSPTELDWPARLKIVKGIAKGMGYLHTEVASSDIPHGNLKSSNVLLSPDYDPLISEYGFSPLINPANAAQELFAYKAPEAAHSGQLSPACDVYCLGIVILEILTGKYPSQYLSNTKGGIDVVQWVASAIADGAESEVFDPEIASCSVNSVVEMKKLLYIGAACTETYPEQRLDMVEAVRRIEEIQVEGGQGEARAMHVLPSLRDGYADSVPQAHVSRSSHEGLGGYSGRMISSDSINASRSGHHNDNNFSFDFSSSV